MIVATTPIETLDEHAVSFKKYCRVKRRTMIFHLFALDPSRRHNRSVKMKRLHATTGAAI